MQTKSIWHIVLLCAYALYSLLTILYHLYAGTCVGLDQSLYLIFVFVGVYCCGLLPYGLKQIRKCSDAYYLTKTLNAMMIVCPAVFVIYGSVAFFTAKDSAMFQYMSTNDIGVIMLVFAQVYTITVPMYRDLMSIVNAGSNGKAEASRVLYLEALCDEIQYEDMRNLSGNDEEDIEPVKHAKISDIIARVSNGALKDLSDLNVELAAPVSKRLITWFATSIPETVPDMTPLSVPMPMNIATIISKTYKLFFAKGAMFEVNIPDQDRDEVIATMEKLVILASSRHHNLQHQRTGNNNEPFNESSEPESPTSSPKTALLPTQHTDIKNIPNSMLQFTNVDPGSMPKNTGDVLNVPITWLDKVKNHILSIIYLNKFARHTKNRGALGLMKRPSMSTGGSHKVSNTASGAQSPNYSQKF